MLGVVASENLLRCRAIVVHHRREGKGKPLPPPPRQGREVTRNSSLNNAAAITATSAVSPVSQLTTSEVSSVKATRGGAG
jgi:hypothetical protein